MCMEVDLKVQGFFYIYLVFYTAVSQEQVCASGQVVH